jgi:RHH-type rel operon transcriptional repressor/antitoxin RelB
MTISLRLNEADTKLFKSYAKMNGMTISELVRSSVIERIEDEYDLNLYKEAMAEFNTDPVTYSLDEVERELGLI